MSYRSLFAAVILLMVPPLQAAPGSASGSMTIDDKVIALKHAYAFAGPGATNAEETGEILLVLTPGEIPPAQRNLQGYAGYIAQQGWSALVLNLDKSDDSNLSATPLAPDGKRVSSMSGEEGLSVTQRSAKAVSGSITRSTEPDDRGFWGRDGHYLVAVDARFEAAIDSSGAAFRAPAPGSASGYFRVGEQAVAFSHAYAHVVPQSAGSDAGATILVLSSVAVPEERRGEDYITRYIKSQKGQYIRFNLAGIGEGSYAWSFDVGKDLSWNMSGSGSDSIRVLPSARPAAGFVAGRAVMLEPEEMTRMSGSIDDWTKLPYQFDLSFNAPMLGAAQQEAMAKAAEKARPPRKVYRLTDAVHTKVRAADAAMEKLPEHRQMVCENQAKQRASSEAGEEMEEGRDIQAEISGALNARPALRGAIEQQGLSVAEYTNFQLAFLESMLPIALQLGFGGKPGCERKEYPDAADLQNCQFLLKHIDDFKLGPPGSSELQCP
ncbi:MAG TPA: hypothetical protein VLI06_10240 [Solimonas sp.]|nr:hypothetical protein [Solimonas sp.]